jgi:hypothetical protein
MAPATERVSTQSIDEAAVTYRFSGSVAEAGETCRHTPHYRNSLCGTSLHGYLTVPRAPVEGSTGYYEGPYDEQGHVLGPYGMVLNVEGRRPRTFPYLYVAVDNDVSNPFTPEDPSPIDTFELAASASYSNDGFTASFMDPTATAIDSQELMPDPSRFSEVCWNDSTGCPLVVGDAASDLRSMQLAFTRSPVVISVPREDHDNPYFMVTAADWTDDQHTTATVTLDIYDSFTFATPTCDLWVELQDSEGAPLHSVQAIVRHEGRGLQHATLSLQTGAPNAERRIAGLNVTCGFSIPGVATIVENTSVWSQ